jgi:type IV pilus assembly protein PilF
MLAMSQTRFALSALRHAWGLRLWIGALLCLLMQGCVTETAGGFGGEASREQALADYLQLAAAYLGEGDLRNARRHLGNVEGLDPDNSEAAALWGLVYSREGENALAETSFLRALSLDGGNSQARNNYAAFLFAQGREQQAYEQLRQVVSDTNYAQRSQAFENLGVAALRLGRMAEAEAAFARALELDGALPRASLELSGIKLDQGDVPQAKRYYDNYLVFLQRQDRAPDAKGLWQGIRLEAALGNYAQVQSYGALLEAGFGASPEYVLYRQLMGTRDND